MKPTLNWKQHLQDRRFADALSAVRALAIRERDPTILMSAARALDRIPHEEFSNQRYIDLRIGFLSGYTYDFLIELTRVLLLPFGIRALVHKTGYGLFEQVILENNAELLEFQPQVIHFGIGIEHIRHLDDVESEAQRWCSLWAKANAVLGCSIVQDTFAEPAERVFGNYELKTALSKTHFVRRLNMLLAEKAPSFVHLNDVDYLAAFHGRAGWRDWKLYDLSRVPVAYDNLFHLSQNLASVLAAGLGCTRKCLVLDLDNTLWGGIVGDVGPEGIIIGQGSPEGEAYLRLQHYVLDLKKRGVVLAVCSKNDGSNATEPFLRRQDMAIALSDISCFVANWNPKPENLKLIARELNLALDSFVFLDDDPTERELVRQVLPEVGIVELTDDPADYVSILASSRFFETTSLTKEDLQRTALYQADRERKHLSRDVEVVGASTDYSEILQSLEMELVVHPFDIETLPRITQLINKTNQFNLTTRRYTDAQVAARINDLGCITVQARLLDRFGDNGMIAVIIAVVKHKVLLLDTWLMSCRVLKRGVEGVLFQELVRRAKARGISTIQGEYIPTARNAMVKRFYGELGFQLLDEHPDGRTTWQIDLDDKREVSEILDRRFPLRLRIVA